MLDATMVLSFAAAALVLLALPGPAVAFVVARSLEGGTRAGIVSQLGLCAGLLVHLIAAIVGISAILTQSAIAFQTLKLLGGVYLVGIGLRTLIGPTSSPEQEERTRADPEPISPDHRKLFRDGFILDALNPKPALFFLAVLPQFVNPDAGPTWRQTACFGFLFIGMAFATGGLYAIAAGVTSRHLRRTIRARRFTKWACGSAYIALGTATAIWRR